MIHYIFHYMIHHIFPYSLYLHYIITIWFTIYFRIHYIFTIWFTNPPWNRPPLAPLRGHRLQQAAAGGLGAATLAAGPGRAGHDGTTAGATRWSGWFWVRMGMEKLLKAMENGDFMGFLWDLPMKHGWFHGILCFFLRNWLNFIGGSRVFDQQPYINLIDAFKSHWNLILIPYIPIKSHRNPKESSNGFVRK
jgi:hypothetical protein